MFPIYLDSRSRFEFASLEARVQTIDKQYCIKFSALGITDQTKFFPDLEKCFEKNLIEFLHTFFFCRSKVHEAEAKFLPNNLEDVERYQVSLKW